MKKLYTLALATVFAGSSFAQMPVPYPKGKTPKNLNEIKKSKSAYEYNSRSQSVTFQLDYMVLDEALEGNGPTFGWDLRTNTNSNQDYTLKHAAVTLDTIVDPSFIGHARQDILSWSIDSAYFAVSHMNTSGQNNDLHFMIIDQGTNDYPDVGTDNILWDTTLSADTSFIDQTTWLQFGVFAFETNVSLTPNQYPALAYEFTGEAGDTSGIIAQYLEDGSCAAFTGGQQKSKVSNFWPNSFVYWYQFDNIMPPDKQNIGVFYDCNSSSAYEEPDDGESFIQDVAFWATLTLEICDLTTSASIVTGDGGGCVGEAIANASGDASPYTYQWDANTGNQTTQTATGLCYNQEYCVTITNQDGCTKVECITMTPPIGVEEADLSSNVSVFPNPSNGEFNVSLNGVEADDYTFTVVNVLGETVLNETIQAAGTYTEQMDLSNLGKGVYVLTVANSKSKSTHKLTIK